MANTTIKITQLQNIGANLSANTLLPVVDTTGTAVTDKVTVGNVANYILTEAGNLLPEAFVSQIAYSVANAAQPNITSVGNLSINTLHITGGDNGQYLQTDGDGNLSWVSGGGSGNGEVGGSSTQIQFNDAGNFGGDPSLTWDAGEAQLNTVNFAASHATIYGNADVVNVNATGNLRPNAIYTDHYYYANGYVFGGGGGNGVPGGANTQVQFNDGGVFAGNTGFTFNKTTGLLSATLLAGGGNGLANIQGANVSGFVSNANVANTAFAVAGANVSGAVSYATTANSVAVANVVGLGNIATVSLSGSSSNVLYGNGVWAPAGGANIGNVTFDNNIVIGTGDTYGGDGLYLAPGPNSLANAQYLQVRGGDYPTHIHFDTGNNNFYDQYFGNDNKYVKLSAGVDGNILIGTDDTTGNLYRWTFDSTGNTTVPGNIKSITTGFSFTSNVTNIDTTSTPGAVYITLADNVFPDAVTGQVTISDVVGTTEANGTWYYQAVDSNAFQLYYDEALDYPVDGTGWTAYVSGGLAVAAGYSNLSITGGNVSIINNNGNVWTFDSTGQINIPEGSNSFDEGRIQSANGYPTLLAYGSSGEHGGPELDWMDSDDPANAFMNANVLRNTMYINDNGLYVGMNENGNANALQASWRFTPYGSLDIPAGNATTTQSGQILSGNEQGFINLDVQFGVDPGQEGGVRLGTSASKPVDIWASSSSQWRFDSDGSLTVPGVIKSIGSYVYRGFYAVLNQISGDDPSINQIVLSRSSSISGSNPTTDTDDDNFIVTGINVSNITAIVNLYGTNTSAPLDLESLFYFIRSYIDLVLYDGNTQRTTISDIQTAFAANEATLLGTDVFAPGTIVDNMKFNAIQAIFQVNGFSHTGSGTDAVFLFDLDEPIGVIDYSTADWNYSDCVVLGTGYQVGDTITVPGTVLGGATPADDMTITIDGIDGSGGITSFTTTGTMSQASYEQSFVKHYIYDGVSDIQDQGNFLGTDISRCVFTAYTDADSNLIVTGVTSGALYPYMTFYEPTNQTYPMVVWQTDGVTEGGTGTYITGGYDTIGSNLPSATYTAYGIPYAVGETLLGTDTWGGGTYGSMVGSNGNGIFSMVCLDGSASTVSYAGNTGSDGDGTKAAISQFAIGAEPQTLNLVSSNNTWSFGTDGNLTVPGNINAAATGSFQMNEAISNITTGSSTVFVTLASGIFPAPVTGKVSIYGVLGTIQANETWWFQATDPNEMQLYTDSALTIPANGTNWTPYFGGGTALSVTYDNLVIGSGNLALGNPNRQWTVYEDGTLGAPSNSSIYGTGNVELEVLEGSQLTNVVNVPVNQTFTGAWVSATYSDNAGAGKIDIVGAVSSLRRFVQLRMQYANQGTALISFNNSPNILTYNGFNYDLNTNTFTISVQESPGDPIAVTTMTLDAVMRNIVQLDSEGGQLNLQSWSGWPVNITSGYQGDVRINAGDDIFLNAGDKTTSDNTGGQIDINAGDGGSADLQDPAGNGGDININSGQGGYASNAYGAGNGGAIYITGAPGGGANATGSHLAGNGGSVVLQAGNAGDNASDINLGREGGNVAITAGYTTGSYVGGGVVITAGQGGIGYGSGNIRLTTQNDGHDTNYNLVLDNTGNLTLPTIITGEGTDEQSIVRSQRKIIPALHYSAAINGSTPTVVYTASSSNISSLKMTISMTHAGLGQEMFDVSAMAAGANVMYSVSNRLNGTGQPDTTVSVDYNGSNILAVTLTVGSGTTTSYVTYDSTEFGYQVD